MTAVNGSEQDQYNETINSHGPRTSVTQRRSCARRGHLAAHFSGSWKILCGRVKQAVTPFKNNDRHSSVDKLHGSEPVAATHCYEALIAHTPIVYN